MLNKQGRAGSFGEEKKQLEQCTTRVTGMPVNKLLSFGHVIEPTQFHTQIAAHRIEAETESEQILGGLQAQRK
jgi:hypothetical protein